ncbi:unnamed protein product [Caenorhabditis auriculariae]|uniref:CRAL-TRIO domain-containing protein n=1 Tax=Caenorhabditis auriculariae TaxID=2777116 RepID=A0A8S1H4W9_9PELO|nr:unnamed protein product [Caenorhabditis auriculariae]
MVQTYRSPVRIYKHPFEIVMAAYEMRFPTCPQIPIFVGSEVAFEYKSEDGAEWVIERKCQLNIDAPYLVKKIAGVDYVYFTQKNSLNRRRRTLDIEASNISFASRIVVKENCTYYVHAENPNWTCFEQSASLDVKSFFGFETTVEKLAVKQYAANLAKGKEILEFFIEELLKKTTYIPPFQDPPHDDQIDETISVADSAIECKETSEGDVVIVGAKEPTRRKSLRTSTTATSATPIAAQASAEDDGVPRTVRASSFDDAESKLEAEYIRRFLGQLNPLEESRLCELKYSLETQHKGKLPNDAHLLRFLRARDFDVAKAKDMVHGSIIWRKQHNVDKLLEEWKPPSPMTHYFPGCWHHVDKSGRPLYLLRLGQLDTKGLLRSCGVENIVKLTLSVCEEGLQKTAEATKRLGVPISSWSLLVDLDGLSMRHLWRPGVQCLLRIIEIVEAHYPETMGQVLIVRAPRVFPVMWTLVSPFIDERTRKKFFISGVGGGELRDELRRHIDDTYLPDFLGGSCLTNCGFGGHVPKTLYRPVEETVDAATSSDVLDSMYTSTSTSKGCPVEVVIAIDTAGSVLTWDFDVLKSECEFVVYYTEKKVEQPPAPSSPTLNPVEKVSAALGGSSHPQPTVAAAPELTLGQDLQLEEKANVFHEGDSMQGSHYCSRAGTYILQWRVPETTLLNSSAFDFGSHKCRFMYYYEILNSADFRGSVASLETFRSSSFSSIAAPPSPSCSTPGISKK